MNSVREKCETELSSSVEAKKKMIKQQSMDKIKVILKVRPRTEKEKNSLLKEQIKINGKSILSFNFGILYFHCIQIFLFTPTTLALFNFPLDHIFGPTSTNSDVYSVISPMIDALKNGTNATIISYGQKASGKTKISCFCQQKFYKIGNDLSVYR